MQGEWERFIDPLRADNTSGAAELARMAAIAILEWIDHTASMPLHTWEEAILAFAPRLYMAQPAMAPRVQSCQRYPAGAGIDSRSGGATAVHTTRGTGFPRTTHRVQELMTTATLGLLPLERAF